MKRKLAFVSLLLCYSSAMAEVTAEEGEKIWDRTRDLMSETWNGVVVAAKGADDSLPTDLDLNPGSSRSETFTEVWEQLMPQLDETLNLSDERSTLPESAWIGRDRVDAQSEIDELLDEAIGILGITEADQFRQHIRDLQQAIADKRETIAEYRRAKVTAPKESAWQTTVEDYEEKIEDLKDEITGHEEEMGKIRDQFARHLKKIGLDLDGEQLEFLLSTVVGEDVVQMGIAFDNVKQMTVQLEKLVAESSEELNTARRWLERVAGAQ